MWHISNATQQSVHWLGVPKSWNIAAQTANCCYCQLKCCLCVKRLNQVNTPARHCYCCSDNLTSCLQMYLLMLMCRFDEECRSHVQENLTKAGMQLHPGRLPTKCVSRHGSSGSEALMLAYVMHLQRHCASCVYRSTAVALSRRVLAPLFDDVTMMLGMQCRTRFVDSLHACC